MAPSLFTPARGRALALVMLFMTSGATSLIYETVWARRLHLVFGTSQLAICTLLAAFMAGLAAGGFAGARWAGTVRRPLLAYAMIELFIGLYAAAFPLLLAVVEPVYLAYWKTFHPGIVGFGLFQFLLLGILLLPPTLCMGATLPLLTGYAAVDANRSGRVVGRLYGANTLGAVIGVGAAGFILLPILGLRATTWLAASANVALAVAAILLDRATRRGPATEEVEQASRPGSARVPAGSRNPAWVLVVIAAVAGFCGLACEVAWFRLMVLLIGGSAYAFSIMLLAFLIGIGAGGWAGGPLADFAFRRRGPRGALLAVAFLEAGVGVLSWAAMFAYQEMPLLFVRLFGQIHEHLWLLWPVKLLLCLGLMLPPALLMGAAFPCLVRAAHAGDPVARSVGRLYGANTLGGLGGAFMGGFFMLPMLGAQGTVLAAAMLNLGAAALAAAVAAQVQPDRRPAARFRWCGAAGVLALLILVVRPAWNAPLVTGGLYQYVSDFSSYDEHGLTEHLSSRSDLLYYAEGLSSVVSVGREGAGGNLWLANNGKVDASSKGDLSTQILLGHLPMLFRPDARQVLVIGLASGITAGCVTLHEAPRHIDIVEIEPAIVAASEYFDAHNNQPLRDPRVALFLNDARNHLKLSSAGHYDVVTSEPSNPWISGVSNLFTREFFELGKRKLAPDGVWAQWLQSYGMATEDLRCLLNTFAAVYTHVRLVRVDDGDLILLGSEAPLETSVESLGLMIGRQPDLVASLGRIQISHPEELVALFMMDRSGIEVMCAGAGFNTDDNMRIEHSAPLHLHTYTAQRNAEMIYGASQLPLDMVTSAAEMVSLAAVYLLKNDAWRARRITELAAQRYPDDEQVLALTKHFESRAVADAARE